MASSAIGSQTSSLIFLPSGIMMDYAGTVSPSGWLMCDGSAVSRTVYANLFAAIGTAYGVGDGSTTFNLPDFRGVFARYMDNMGTPAGAAGRDAGRAISNTPQAQGTKRPTTNFTSSSSSVSGTIDGGSHSHSITLGQNWGGSTGGTAGWSVDNGTPQGNSTQNTTSTSHSHSHSLTAAGQTITGGGDAETRPINVACYRIIKV